MHFSALSLSSYRPVRIARYGVTLVTLLIDESASTEGFTDELRRMVQMILSACRSTLYHEHMYVQSIAFAVNIRQIHPFTPLSDIDINAYPHFVPRSMTALHTATKYAIRFSISHARRLKQEGRAVSSVIFVITDGGENASVGNTSKRMVGHELYSAKHSGYCESFLLYIIGINTQDAEVNAYLERFCRISHADGYIAANAAELSILSEWIFRSVARYHQYVGTGILVPQLTWETLKGEHL